MLRWRIVGLDGDPVGFSLASLSMFGAVGIVVENALVTVYTIEDFFDCLEFVAYQIPKCPLLRVLKSTA